MTAQMPLSPPSPSVSEEMIHRQVHAFYARVRADEELGPIFARVIGDDWDPHLAKMCDFWSSVMLTSGRYKGNPMIAHMRLKMVRPAHFERWLDIFAQTARAECPPAIADQFCARAANIARSLQLGMFWRPQGTPASTTNLGESDEDKPRTR